MASERKKKSRQIKTSGRWWIGIAAATIGALVIWAALRMPIHETAPPSVVHPQVTVSPPMGPRRLDLGSYGVTITDSRGRNRFLTIHPIAEVLGKGNWSGLRAVQPEMDAAIENPFMAFPDLARVPDSIAARDHLKSVILRSIASVMARADPGWRITDIHLQVAVKAMPVH
ncbi:MAG: hypothetical protein ACYDCX_02530 [Acidithiobacillus sp.]